MRLKRAGVPVEYRTARTKPEIALAEIDRVMAAGVRFGCVLADAGYGLSAPVRQGLTARSLAWAVGIPRHLKVYPVGVQLIWPVAARGRPRRRHVPDILSMPAEDMLANAKWQNISWRTGTKESSKPALPLSECGSLTDLRSGSGTRVSSIFRGRGMAHRRAPDIRREEILSRQPARRYGLARLGRHHQGAVDLRAGPSAAERRTRPRSLRGTILARSSSSRAHDNDRLRLPPTSPPYKGAAEKRINGPPPQPSLPAVRHAIANLMLRSPPHRCPHCRRWIGAGKQHEMNLPK